MIELSPDVRWEKEMRPGARRMVELLSWPMMLRYGYSLGRRADE